MGAEAHAGLGPGVEVVGDGDGAAGALAVADGPELLEVGGALDRGRVVALADAHLVDAAVAGHGALVRGARRRVVRPKVLDNVVLDQRVARPAVDGQVAVAVGAVGPAVVDGAVFELHFSVRIGRGRG